MRSKVSSDWLPSYINATRPVLEIFKMARCFPDSPCTKMALQEVGWEGGGSDWTYLAQDRDTWRARVKCGNESSGSINVGKFLTS